MAYDDYFVIMAQVLSYLYSCMKKGKKVDAKEISYEKLEINQKYHRTIVGDMFESGYIKAFASFPDNELEYNRGNIAVTAKGIEYLHEANVMHRALAELKKLGGEPAEVVEFLGL